MKKISLKDNFILFKQPKSSEINFWKLGKEICRVDAFFVQSFDNCQKETFGPIEKIIFSINEFNPDLFELLELNITSSEPDISKENYLLICQNLINYLANSELQKVILSRIKKIKPYKNPISHFLKLTQKYPEAMVYLWRNNQDVWIGATPETLAVFHKGEFSTMALAGTKKTELKTDWTVKEYNEHNFVINYISEVLKNYSPEISSTKTLNLGNLEHLITHINAKVPKAKVLEIIEELHPTPAVCGLPKENAKNWILENETHKREFYTGFLGFRIGEDVFSYVNLRCAKLHKDSSDVYVGGGITKDSNSLAEWNETELKANSLVVK